VGKRGANCERGGEWPTVGILERPFTPVREVKKRKWHGNKPVNQVALSLGKVFSEHKGKGINSKKVSVEGGGPQNGEGRRTVTREHHVGERKTGSRVFYRGTGSIRDGAHLNGNQGKKRLQGEYKVSRGDRKESGSTAVQKSGSFPPRS